MHARIPQIGQHKSKKATTAPTDRAITAPADDFPSDSIPF
jgi:hypothetical protein